MTQDSVALCGWCRDALRSDDESAPEPFVCGESTLCAVCASLHTPGQRRAAHSPDTGCVRCKPVEWARTTRVTGALNVTFYDGNMTPQHTLYQVPHLAATLDDQLQCALDYLRDVLLPGRCPAELARQACDALQAEIDKFAVQPNRPPLIPTHTLVTDRVVAPECSIGVALVCTLCADYRAAPTLPSH